ncbi:MAG: hypothetical protein JOZ20_08640 [Sphingomonas sp.]|nr:hypothetical protein [Sphingomonas sp.]MBW0006494.1 hypothetical protein [Sphingomonas sp.]
MIRALAALSLLLASGAGAKTDLGANGAFVAAFGKSGSVILKRQGEYKETVKYTPGALVEAPFGPVLVSIGEVVDGSHASSGKVAAVYMRRSGQGLAVAKRFVPAMETGSFGSIGKWRVSRAYGSLPVVEVEGGGTWQGYTCSVTTLLEIASDKPRELVNVPLYYDDAGAVVDSKPTRIEGRIVRAVANKSFDVDYSGTRRFTDRYIRRGDQYVLVGKSSMETC